MKTVYLAGPITGLDYAGATDWRNEAKLQLALEGITGLSPMRGKEYLSAVKEFTMDGDKYSPFSVMSSNRGITLNGLYLSPSIVNSFTADKYSLPRMGERPVMPSSASWSLASLRQSVAPA